MSSKDIGRTKTLIHVNFSSILSFASIVSAFVPVKFYDYRPAHLQLNNWESDFANLTKLSFADNNFPSVSCMHTVKHIGLGRYGNSLDTRDDEKAVEELIRVTQPGGNIFFVTPAGRQMIEFNAHRIYGYELVIEMFEGWQLQSFSLIPYQGGIINNAAPSLVAN